MKPRINADQNLNRINRIREDLQDFLKTGKRILALDLGRSKQRPYSLILFILLNPVNPVEAFGFSFVLFRGLLCG